MMNIYNEKMKAVSEYGIRYKSLIAQIVDLFKKKRKLQLMSDQIGMFLDQTQNEYEIFEVQKNELEKLRLEMKQQKEDGLDTTSVQNERIKRLDSIIELYQTWNSQLEQLLELFPLFNNSSLQLLNPFASKNRYFLSEEQVNLIRNSCMECLKQEFKNIFTNLNNEFNSFQNSLDEIDLLHQKMFVYLSCQENHSKKMLDFDQQFSLLILDTNAKQIENLLVDMNSYFDDLREYIEEIKQHEQNANINEQNANINEQNANINEQNYSVQKMIKNFNDKMNKKDEQINEKNKLIEEQIKQIPIKNQEIDKRNSEIDRLNQEIEIKIQEIKKQNQEIEQQNLIISQDLKKLQSLEKDVNIMKEQISVLNYQKEFNETLIYRSEIYVKFIEAIKKEFSLDRNQDIFSLTKNDPKFSEEINKFLNPHKLNFPGCVDLLRDQKQGRNEITHPTLYQIKDKKEIFLRQYKELNDNDEIIQVYKKMISFLENDE